MNTERHLDDVVGDELAAENDAYFEFEQQHCKELLESVKSNEAAYSFIEFAIKELVGSNQFIKYIQQRRKLE